MIPFNALTSFQPLAFVSLLLLAATGCVSKKPLPYEFSQPTAAVTGAPKVAVRPIVNARPQKDNLDKLLHVPSCLQPVLAKELEGCGLFSGVETNEAGPMTNVYVVETTLKDLRWEVPEYGRKVGTTMALSFFTGGIGGLAYASTSTDVYGHANVRFAFREPSGGRALLERDYVARATTRKSKLACDTPATYREIAAKAIKDVIEQFKADLGALKLSKAQ